MKSSVKGSRGGRPLPWVLLLAGSVVAFSATAIGAAREAPPSPLVERVTSELVLIEAYVTDLHGQPLKGLGPENFVLQIDGKVAPIASLEYHDLGAEAGATAGASSPGAVAGGSEPAAKARRFVLYFEDAISSTQGLTIARRAALKFIDSGLTPSDQVAIVAHGKQVVVLCDFTTDRTALRRAIETSLADTSRVSDFMPHLLDRERDLREVYRDSPAVAITDAKAMMLRVDVLLTTFAKEDAARVRGSFDALRSVIAALAPWPGYKGMIYMGDAIPENPALYYLDRLHDIPNLASSDQLSSDVEVLNLRSELKAVIDAAAASGVTVHTVDTGGIAGADSFGTPGSSSRRASQHRSNSLPTISLNTGGISSSTNDPLAGLAEAEASSRAYYVIGYAPPGPPDGRTHSVLLRVRKASARLIWRRQFVRVRPEEAHARSLQAAHLLPELYPDLDLDLSIVPGPADRSGHVVDLVLHVPSERITFLPGEAGRTATLDVGLVALDTAHREVLRLSRNVTIHLDKGGELRPGLDLFHRASLPSSVDSITAVVTDLGTGAIGAVRLEGPLRLDDDAGVLGLSIYSLSEQSLWLELPAAADAPPTEATVGQDRLGPALRGGFTIGEPLACGFRLEEPGDPASPLKIVIRKGDTTLKSIDVGLEALDAARGAGGAVKTSLPVDGLPPGDYVLLIQGMKAGKSIDLAKRPFSLREAPAAGPAAS